MSGPRRDEFGISVAIDGDDAVVGAWRKDPAGFFAGRAYIFQREAGSADAWGEVAKLTASDAQAFDRFGMSVAVNGAAAVAGAHFEDARGDQPGAAYLFDLLRLKSAQVGDVNCDGTVNTIDVALVFQIVVALLASLPCADRADVNDDGTIDSLDAALILQFTAGLVDRLPIGPKVSNARDVATMSSATS